MSAAARHLLRLKSWRETCWLRDRFDDAVQTELRLRTEAAYIIGWGC